jgi:hypothetical protein
LCVGGNLPDKAGTYTAADAVGDVLVVLAAIEPRGARFDAALDAAGRFLQLIG